MTRGGRRIEGIGRRLSGAMGGAGGGRTLVAQGLQGWAAANHYSHASTNTGPKLTATGGTIGILYRLDSVPSAANRIFTSFWDGVSEGYAAFASRSGGATPRFITRGAGSTNIDWSAAYGAGDVGKVFFDSMSIDGDADLEAYRQGASAATLAPGSGLVQPGASSRFRIGDNAEAPDHATIVGVVFCAATRLTPAEHAAWFNTIQQTGGIVAAPTGTTDIFTASTAGATWVSSGSAATTLTRTGTFSLVDVAMVFA